MGSFRIGSTLEQTLSYDLGAVTQMEFRPTGLLNQLNKEMFGPPGQAAENFDPAGGTSTSEYNHIKNDFRKANKDTDTRC